MDRIERTELIEDLKSYISFHEDKANYYNDWLIEESIKLRTIGFLTTENVLKDRICFTTVNSDVKTIEETY